MVYFLIQRGLCTIPGVKGPFGKLQTGFSSFAEPQQDQSYGPILLMAKKNQLFGFQFFGGAADDETCQTLRTVDEEYLPSEFDGPPGGMEQFLHCAGVFLPRLR